MVAECEDKGYEGFTYLIFSHGWYFPIREAQFVILQCRVSSELWDPNSVVAIIIQNFGIVYMLVVIVADIGGNEERIGQQWIVS